MKVQMKTILVGLDEEGFYKKGSLSNVVCGQFVQYFASGNYGFVKILNWNDLIDQEIESTRELLKGPSLFSIRFIFKLTYNSHMYGP